MMVNGPVYPFSVVMNLDKWNSLPQDVKDVMDGLSVEQAFWTGNYMDNHVEESVAWSKKNHNIEITELSGETLAELEKLVSPITDKWAGSAKEKGVNTTELLKDIKAARDYHSRF